MNSAAARMTVKKGTDGWTDGSQDGAQRTLDMMYNGRMASLKIEVGHRHRRSVWHSSTLRVPSWSAECPTHVRARPSVRPSASSTFFANRLSGRRCRRRWALAGPTHLHGSPLETHNAEKNIMGCLSVQRAWFRDGGGIHPTYHECRKGRE